MDFQLLICIVKDDDAVETILTAFVELGVTGGTVLTGRGMAEVIASQVPLFAGFRDVFKATGESRVILTAMESDAIAEAIQIVEGVISEESGDASGICFAVPITAGAGFKPPVSNED